MSHLAHAKFVGSSPRIEDFLLQPGQAARSVNCKFTTGSLVPFNGPKITSVQSGTDVIQGLYRYRHQILGRVSDNWMVWPNKVQAVRSPLANDELGRVYFTGDGEPRMTTYAAAISGPGPFPAGWFVLGVTPPAATMSLAVVGGSGATETRAYFCTFVTSLGEESGPGPHVSVTGFINGSWNLSAIPTAFQNSGTVTAAVKDTPGAGAVTVTLNSVDGLVQFEWLTLAGVVGMTDLNGAFRVESIDTAAKQVVVNLSTTQTYTTGGSWSRLAPHNTSGMVKRVYRTNTGSASTNYQFVAEIPVAQTTYNDVVLSSDLGEVCPTLNYLPPPKDLVSLIALPNGCYAGLSGNEVCLSEPYLPYAWPLENRYALADKGVALAAVTNGLIALTDNFPMALVGDDPAGMTPSTIESYAPCISASGVVDVGNGCIYPSHDGLWLVSMGAAQNITSAMFRQDQWAPLNPSSIVAAVYDGAYVFSFEAQPGVIAMGAISITEPTGFVEITEAPTALAANPYDGMLYFVSDKTVYKFDADEGNPYTAIWESGTTQFTNAINMAIAKVAANYRVSRPTNDVALAQNAALMVTPWGIAGAIAEAEILSLPVAGSLLELVVATAAAQVGFELIADDQVIFSTTRTSGEAFALPGGSTYERVKIRLQPTVPLRRVDLATSLRELKGVGA